MEYSNRTDLADKKRRTIQFFGVSIEKAVDIKNGALLGSEVARSWGTFVLYPVEREGWKLLALVEYPQAVYHYVVIPTDQVGKRVRERASFLPITTFAHRTYMDGGNAKGL